MQQKKKNILCFLLCCGGISNALLGVHSCIQYVNVFYAHVCYTCISCLHVWKKHCCRICPLEHFSREEDNMSAQHLSPPGRAQLQLPYCNLIFFSVLTVIISQRCGCFSLAYYGNDRCIREITSEMERDTREKYQRERESEK